jgi:hypothetical protein
MRVNATTSEARIEIDTVSAWSLKSCAAKPSTNTTGRNTATVVKVTPTSALPTSAAPRPAAVKASSPSSLRRWIASSTTTALSTSMPTPRARPPRDITLRLTPKRCMKKNVAMMETGMVMPMIRVLKASFRKKNRITMARRPPSTAFSSTSSMALSMKRDWSTPAPTFTPSGSSLRSASSRARTARATRTVFASPSL